MLGTVKGDDYEFGPLVLPPLQLSGAACCIMQATWGRGGGGLALSQRQRFGLWRVTGPESSRGCILWFVVGLLGAKAACCL